LDQLFFRLLKTRDVSVGKYILKHTRGPRLALLLEIKQSFNLNASLFYFLPFFLLTILDYTFLTAGRLPGYGWINEHLVVES
jgi:hypothetical protein